MQTNGTAVASASAVASGWVAVAVGWVIVGFIAAFCITFLVLIWRDKINLSRLISEINGDASLSRLQFLIFTVVISMSLFLVIMAAKPVPAFPNDIPAGILTLLGISGSSYLVSKGIQFSNPAGLNRPALQLSPSHTNLPSVPSPIQLTVSMPPSADGSPVPAIQWSLDAPAEGSIQPSGSTATYTPPNPVPANFKVVVRAQAAGFEDGLAVIAANSAGLNHPALQLSPSRVSVAAAAPGPIQLTASLLSTAAGTPMPTIQWSLDAPAEGTIHPVGTTASYTPPDPLPAGFRCVVRAQATGFEDGLAEIVA